ncbi:MAG: hypothetical protein LJE75_06875 [Gammaproteobacteria bacterium]|jgi:hypothetical protein|nr:hypothetical protein [Gammaproteobacteria bacterium]
MIPLRSITPGEHAVVISLLAVALACLIATDPVLAIQTAPRLSSDTDTATAGFYRLEWQSAAELVELQEATDAGFEFATTIYTGPDRATVLSGKSDGTRYYRVRANDASQNSPWSNPIAVTVVHHSLSRALLFLFMGIFVFLAIVTVVVRGPAHKR